MKDKRGFTLLQTMLAAVLGAIVIIGAFQLFSYSSITFNRQNNSFVTSQELGTFLLMFTKDIHKADSVNVISPTVVNLTVNNGSVTYVYSNNRIERNGKPVVQNISYAQFNQTPETMGNLMNVVLSKNGQKMETTVYAK